MWGYRHIKSIRTVLRLISKRKILSIITVAVFLVFVILGAVLPKGQEKFFYCESTVNIFVVSLSPGGKISKLFLNRLFADCFCLLIFYFTSYAIFLMPINFLIIAYKGYVLGAIFISLISNFGFTGIMLFIFGVLIQNLIALFALVIMTISSFNNKTAFSDCNLKIKNYLLYVFLFSATLIVISVIAQFIFVLLFLRPLNYSFLIA